MLPAIARVIVVKPIKPVMHTHIVLICAVCGGCNRTGKAVHIGGSARGYYELRTLLAA